MVRNLLYVLIGAFSVALFAPTERPPVADEGVAIAVVLDTSGSMAEGGRLDEAREALAALASALGPNDRLGLITFNREATVLVAPSRPSVPSLTALLSAVEPAGPTNLHAGLLQGHAQLMALRGPRRVVVISDGAANTGVVDEGALLRCAGALTSEGIEVSVLGLGEQDRDRLRTLGRVGRGGFAPSDGVLRERLLDQLTDLRGAPVRLARAGL